MAMLDETALRQLFRKRVRSVLPRDVQVAWENQTFEPPSLEDGIGPVVLWMRELVRTLDETKSSTGFIEAVGEVLYMIETPAGKGTEAADALAKIVAESLQAGQSLTSPTLTVIVEHTERRPYREDPEHPAWTFKTVACRWRTFTPV